MDENAMTDNKVTVTVQRYKREEVVDSHHRPRSEQAERIKDATQRLKDLVIPTEYFKMTDEYNHKKSLSQFEMQRKSYPDRCEEHWNRFTRITNLQNIEPASLSWAGCMK